MADATRTPTPFEETRSILITFGRRKFGSIAVERIVDHVLAVTRGADFAVFEAALEALVRRKAFATRDALVVLARPARGQVCGLYRTGPKGKGARAARPYATLIESSHADPAIAGSCDCADFVRSSLGLCKHLLVVLDAIYRDGRSSALMAPRTGGNGGTPRATWDPRLPLLGDLDRLNGLRVGPGFASTMPRVFDGESIRPDVLAAPRVRRDVLRALDEAMRANAIDATPGARRVVEEELARSERRFRASSHAPRAAKHLGSLARKLYPYQLAGVTRFLAEGRLLLADDMGLGKTTQAIAACHALFRSRRVTRGIVIAPSSLKPQWLREWEETTSVPARIVEGSPDERREIYENLRSGFLIVSYEQLLRDFDHVVKLAPEIVVLDEAQRIKNFATKSAAYVKSLDPEYRVVLTGTPMENRLEELASILDWVDDVALAPKWRLVPWHTFREGDADHGIGGARNLVSLRARLATATLRRVRKDVIAQLPSRTDTRVPVEMTEQQMRAHDELDRPIAVLVSQAKKRPLTQPEFLRLMSLLTQQRVISNGLAQASFDEFWPSCARSAAEPSVLEGLFSPKLGELRRLIADLVVDQDRKVVVFSQWRRMLRLAEWSVRDLLAGAGRRAVFFTGAESTALRTRAIADFHDDPNASVMFLTDAGGVGLNLQRAANVCINLELPWNPAVLEQRIGRIYRLGQKSPIDVYNLVSEEGIESRIAAIVGAKQALFTNVFEGTTDEVVFEEASSSSFLTQVESLLPSSVGSKGATIETSTDDGDVVAPPDDRPELPVPPPPATISPSVADALASVRVERGENGSLRLEAPPEAAAAMAALFETMSRLLRASVPPG